MMYPEDRILVAVVAHRRDWEIIQTERWYRVPVKHAPPGAPDFDWVAFYFTRAFGDDRWAIHYYCAVLGHELVTRRDLIPSEPDHPHACDWYYKLQLGLLQHKIPPIISPRWRRITFIITTGDRFMNATEVTDLFDPISPWGGQFVTLKEI
ncbi:MAG: hypothetical protein ACUVSB_05395 [Anaerolineae bacterium]